MSRPWSDLEEFMTDKSPMAQALDAVGRMNDYILGGDDPWNNKGGGGGWSKPKFGPMGMATCALCGWQPVGMGDHVDCKYSPKKSGICSMCGKAFARSGTEAAFRADMCRTCMEESLCEDYSGGDGV